eukprot:scaffold20596_cov47-Attheya_sp.AAC.3
MNEDAMDGETEKVTEDGYDVVFVEVVNKDDEKEWVVVHFGQVTKSDSHSISPVYECGSRQQWWCVASAHHLVYGTPLTKTPSEMHANCWLKTKEHEYISIYRLDMKSMDYPEAWVDKHHCLVVFNVSGDFPGSLLGGEFTNH